MHREFYFNDAGGQIHRLAISVRARYQQLLGHDAPVPEERLPGRIRFRNRRRPDQKGRPRGTRTTASEDALEAMRCFAVALLRREQERDLAAFNVRFDEYYPETRLYSGRARRQGPSGKLRETGLTYREDGALWLRTIGLRRPEGQGDGEEQRVAHLFPAGRGLSHEQVGAGLPPCDQRAGIGSPQHGGPRAGRSAGARPPARLPRVRVAPDGDSGARRSRRSASPSGQDPTPRWPIWWPRSAPMSPGTSSSCAGPRAT